MHQDIIRRMEVKGAEFAVNSSPAAESKPHRRTDFIHPTRAKPRHALPEALL
jgi:hypothetical protein